MIARHCGRRTGSAAGSGRGPAGRRCPALVLFAILLLFADRATAQSSQGQIKVLLDLDDNPATGCTVATPAGSFSGAERVVIATFDTTSSTVTAIQVQVCSGSVLGAPTSLAGPFSPPWPIGPGNGAAASTLIESYFPLSGGSAGRSVRAGFVLGDGVTDQDALLPLILISTAPTTSIPTLSEWGLLLLSASLLLAGLFLLRRHPGGLAVLGAIAMLAGVAGVAWAAIGLNGSASDWTGIAPLGTKAASVNPTHPEILAVYGAADAGNVFFRVDATVGGLGPTPTATSTPTGQTPTATVTPTVTPTGGSTNPTPTPTPTGGSGSPTPTSTPTAPSGTPTPTPTGTPSGSVVTIDPVSSQTVPTNTTLSLRLAGHSTDVFAVLTYAIVSGPVGASVTPAGVFTFTPSPSELGPTTVTARVQDQGGRSALTTFDVTVVDHNHPPVLGALADDAARVGTTYTKTLTASDPDPGDTLTFTLLSGPAGMTLSGSTLSWTPTAAQLGSWPVEVRVTDRAGASASGLFHVSIAFLTATDDAYSVNLGKTLAVVAPGVLGNDVDPLSGPLQATKLSNPDKGAMTAFGADGSFTYQAPPVLPGPVFAPVVRYHVDSMTIEDPVLVADVDGDGKPEMIVLNSSGAGITVLRGTDGSVLWNTPTLPAPAADCTAAGFTGGALYHLAVGDIDDSGQLAIVFPTSCGRDNQPSGIVGTSTARYAALNARDGSLKWLSPPLSRELDALGNPDPMAAGTVPTLARVRFGETPSIVVGNDLSYFPFNGKPECDQLVAGWPANVACRGVVVLDGVDGAVRQRMAAPIAAEYDRTTYGNGTQAAVVADLDGDGNVEFIFGGAVFNNDGSVRSNNTDNNTGNPQSYWNGVANFDDTPDIEVARLEGNGIGAPTRLSIYKSDGRRLWSLPLPGTSYTGLPVIADVDGSGRPAIVFAVDGNVCAVDYKGMYKWCHDVGAPAGVSNVSVGSRVQVFDLDGDGVPEVIVPVNGEILLFLDGATGNVKFSFDMSAANGPPFPPFPTTGFGGPVVADLDGSGHAGIAVVWYGFNGPRLDVVGSQNNDWRPARKIFNQESYQFGNVNDDGSIPAAFVNNFATPATNVFAAQPQVLAPVDPRKKSQTSFTYSASDGALVSAPGTVTIDILPSNSPPVFVSKAPTRYVAPDFSFTYASQALDPDPGDTVTYGLKIAQGNGGGQSCAMAAATGVLTCILFSGEQDIVIVATDSFGASAYQMIQLQESAGPAPVPNVVGDLQPAAGVALTAAGFATGTVTPIDNPAPAGQVIQQNPGGGTSALLGSSVDLVVSKGPIVPPPTGPPPPLGNLERIVVTPASTVRLVGDTLAYKAVGINTDGTAADITLFAVWSSSVPAVATVDATGTVRAVGSGTTVIAAAAGGLSGPATLNVTVRIPGDVVPPTAIITAPASGGTVTGLTQILGTAADTNFLRYELALEASGDTTFTLIGQGTTPVSNGVLGSLDPTLLLNGAYTLRLTVFDANHNDATAQVPIVVDGFQKVGNFTLVYTDLTVPLAGIPVQITRIYDSRDKNARDFGVGWSLAVKALRLSASGPQGTDWEVIQDGVNYALVPDRDHFLSVTLPSGRVETFDLLLTPTASFLEPFSTLQATFLARPGTLGSLSTLDNVNILITDPQPGPITLLDDTTLNTFDPDRFLYTQQDGTQFVVTRSRGVESVKDTNGNQITIGPGGITHSSGAAVVFTRDSAGRIVGIADPKGLTQSYAYSSTGDLLSHTDSASATTSWFYDAQHGIVRVVNPLGTAVARSDYDDEGRLLSITDAAGHTTTYSHDLPGREVQVQDVLGNTTVFHYDERGNVLTATDPLGHTTTSTFDAQDNETSRVNADGLRTATTYSGVLPLTTVVDPGGLNLTTSNAFNAAQDVTSVTDPAGRVFGLTYDGNRNVTQLNTPVQGLSTSVLDGRGLPIRVTDALGNARVLTRDASGNVTREDVLDASSALVRRTDSTFDANGNKLSETLFRTIGGVLTPLTTTYQYDGAGRPVRAVDPAGGVTSAEYDATGRLTASVDTLGRRSVFAYDDLGRRVRTTFPDETFESVAYDAAGNVLSRTDAAGRSITFDYDSLNRAVATHSPDGTSTQTIYTPGGRIAATVDSRGNRTDFAYDAAGRLIGTTLPAVQNGVGGPVVRPQTSRVLTALGAPAATTDANGRQTSFQYDSAGRPVQTTFADGSISTRAFDVLGRRTQSTTEDGLTTTFQFDALGRTVAVAGAAGDATYTYDEAGNRLSQTDALGRTTTFLYDVLNRLTSRTYPGGEIARLSYDAAGDPIAATDGNGRTTAFTYDVMSRLARKELPDGSSVAFHYAADGQRESVTDANGTKAFYYDAIGRLSRVEYPTGETVAYDHDANGNLVSVASPAASVSYSFDALDRLTVVNAPEGQSQYFYDLAGNRVRLVAPNGVRSDSVYDARNRPTQLTHRTIGGTVLQSFSNTYSAAGRRTQVTESDGSQENYSYDSRGRLVSETRTGAGARSVTHAYDAVGNRTQVVENGVTTPFNYDNDDRVINAGIASYTHDANGNLLSVTAGSSTTQYAYDFENRLTSITGPSGVTRYAYDADGNRIQSATPAGTTRFLVDGQNNTGLSQVLEEHDGGGSLLARYSYGSNLLSMSRGAASSFYHRDVQGSTRLLTDTTGSATDSYLFDAYGRTVSSTGTTDNSYLYGGQRSDVGTGLYQLRARYYAPGLGRFLSRDPLVGSSDVPASLHRYNYAGGDPVNNGDPTGLESVPIDIVELSEAALDGETIDTAEFVAKAALYCRLSATLDMVKLIASTSLLAVQAFNGADVGGAHEIVFAEPESAKPGQVEKLKFALQYKGGKGQFSFGIYVNPKQSFTVEATFPPVNLTGELAITGEKILTEFKPCGTPVGKVAASMKGFLKGGGGAAGAIASGGFSIDLKLYVFGNHFEATYPVFGVDPNFLGGTLLCPTCDIGSISFFGTSYPIADVLKNLGFVF